jgi:hypothetical protein
MPKTVVTLLAVLVAGCRASERTESAGPSREPPSRETGSARGLRVYDDDTVFLELQKDQKAAERDFTAEWKTLHIDRDFKQEKQFHGSLAQLFLTLLESEKQSLLVWLEANPLADADKGLVARVTLGDERAVEEVAAVLESGDPERCRNLVGYLSWFDWTDVPRLHQEREALLLPLLDHADPVVVSRLTSILEKQEEAFWWEAVKRRMSDRKYPNKSRLVSLMKNVSSPEAVDLVRQAMRHRAPGENPELFLYALQHMTEGDDLERRGRAEEALFAAVEEAPEESGSAYFFLFQRDPDRTMPLAEKYLARVMKQATLENEFPASYVLREWGRRRKNEDVLRQWTRHPQLGRYALEALTELQVGSENEGLAEEWLELATRTKYPYVYNQVASIGGEKAKEVALRLLKESGSPPQWEIGLFWALNDITLEKACEMSVRHGLLPKMPSAETLRTARMEDDPLGSRFRHWVSVMVREGRAAHFDAETGTFPNRHDELILKELLEGGGGLFQPTRAIEVWRKDGEYYDVAFEHRGKWYRFGAENLGDWYDVDAVMDAANRALEDGGVSERFHSIVTGGQDALLVLATSESLQAAARELSLPTEQNAESARDLGKAFEAAFIERLGAEGK